MFLSSEPALVKTFSCMKSNFLHGITCCPIVKDLAKILVFSLLKISCKSRFGVRDALRHTKPSLDLA